MTDLIQQVEQTIQTRGLVKPGQAVLAAVSGGVDSMVLLDVLAQLADRHCWKFAVAHFNHRLRGNSSAADRRFVEAVSKRLGLRFISGEGDVRAHAMRHKLSIEMAARQLRHEFLAAAARRVKAHSIVLAHHADDQTELFFLRLLRGSGDEGLAGMKWRNPSPVDSGIELIRPLLDVTKQQLAEYAESQRVRFRQDATNNSQEILRNRIRHELLPLLRQKYQPALDRVVRRVSSISAQHSEFVTEAARGWLANPGSCDFFRLHAAVQRRCIQLQLRDLGVDPDFDLVERLRGAPEVPICVGPQKFVLLDASGRIQRREHKQLQHELGRASLVLRGPFGSVEFDGRSLSWRIMSSRRAVRRSSAGREIFDADRVGSTVELRHWRPGDRFQPSGMQRSVKLQDLFTNARIPREERHRLLVATTAAGEIFWVEKLRISEQFKVSDRTNRRLLWHWKPL